VGDVVVGVVAVVVVVVRVGVTGEAVAAAEVVVFAGKGDVLDLVVDAGDFGFTAGFGNFYTPFCFFFC
jgi:hypothetical protein